MALPRSAGAVAAMLAVGQAGAVYLPVDPAAPAARLDLLLADARPAVVITEPGADLAPGWPVLEVDAAGEPAGGVMAEADPAPASPGSAAYMIYTSGTTGVPKGVVVEQRSLVSLLAARRPEYAALSGDPGPAAVRCGSR